MSGGHAHYVIAEGGAHRVWCRGRGAHTLHHDVLWGPERTIAFIRDQDGGTPDFWMNSVWWQAVALIDLDRRRLLVHTDQCINGPDRATSVPEIRAWLRLVAALWPRWHVTWAAQSLHEVMEHLGLPYDTVRYLDDPPFPLRDQWAGPPVDDEDGPAEAVLAIRDAAGGLTFGGWSATTLADPLRAGPGALLTPQDEAAPFAAMDTVPWSGAYVDAPARRLDYWSADCPLAPAHLDAPWRGWTVTDHGDAYEEVAALIGPEILIDTGPDDALPRVAGWFEQDTTDPGDLRTLHRALSTITPR